MRAPDTTGAPGVTRASLRGRPGARLSLRVLAVLAALALCAEMIASPLPWVGRVDGHLYVLPNVFTPAALAGKSRAEIESHAVAGDFAFGPPVHFGPYDPDLDPDGAPRVREAPSSRHLFGTDSHGRDVLARVLYGTRVELSAAVVAVTAQLLLGAILGALAGFIGGLFDAIVTRAIEALTAVPLLLLLVVVQALVTHPTLSTLLMAYAATRWTEVARLVRVEVMRVSQSDYVLAARARGAQPRRVGVHHKPPPPPPPPPPPAAPGRG
jgi:ABC-type dipeptide/oligopeptide/nickel transport system permease subunit